MTNTVFENVLLEGLHNRILACIPYGVDNIWMKTDGEERYHAANILGYDLQQWETLLKYSGLRDKSGRCKHTTWTNKLKCGAVEFRTFRYRTASGQQSKKTPLIKFTCNVPSSGRGRGASEPSSIEAVNTDGSAGAVETYVFDSLVIPKDKTRCRFKCIPPICYISGDLSYLMMLYGRHGHASCKCPYCDALQSEFHQQCICGTSMFTNESIALEIENYRIAHLPIDHPDRAGLTDDQFEAVKTRLKLDCAKSGLKVDDILHTTKIK